MNGSAGHPMQVIATAGHVDHGKSALVRALTGMEPDRWAEERRRGLTIDLGFAWLTRPDGQRLAFVDVPGHERFVPNMLAGVGPVPAVLFVVAADGGWMPQSSEHLAAIDALGISHGVLAVTRADLADPGPAIRRASAELARTSLGRVPAVAVSSLTGQGLAELRAALASLAAALPAPDPAAPVRLWVDRVFSMTGSGTVVTGTLPAGTLRTDDELLVTPAGRTVRVRAIESLKEKVTEVSGVARVAVNLRGTAPAQLARGMALTAPGSWTLATVIDVRLSAPAESRDSGSRLPREVTVHIGSARTRARVRSFGGALARLTLAEPLPLHVGDRLLLRDPGAARPAPGKPAHNAPAPFEMVTAGVAPPSAGPAGWAAITGATVLDVSPPAAPRRGAAAAIRAELGGWPDPPGAGALLRRHGILRASALRAMGIAVPTGPVSTGPVSEGPVSAAGWLVDAGRWAELRERLGQVVAEHADRDPLAVGMPLEAARAALGLPDRKLAEKLAAGAGPLASGQRITLRDGYLRIVAMSAPGGPPEPFFSLENIDKKTLPVETTDAIAAVGADNQTLPGKITDAVAAVRADLAGSPFRAPEAGRLRELGLDRKAIAAAGRAGLLLRISPDIVLAPGADARAAAILATLPQPFTTAQARQALDTTRRVAIPLLEYLDRASVTRRLPDDRRELRQH